MMIASSTSSLTDRLLASTPISTITEPKPKPEAPSTLPTNQTDSEPLSDPQSSKLKGSPQLNRWSRARSIRSGRKLDRSLQRTQTLETMDSPVRTTDGEEVAEEKVGKSIYMVSDGTGSTAEHAVTAALGQFDYCSVDRGCPVNTHLFSGECSSFHCI